MEQVLELYYDETGSWNNAQQIFFSNGTSETPLSSHDDARNADEYVDA